MQARTISQIQRMIFPVLLSVAAETVWAQVADRWPMARHDGRRSSQGAFGIPSEPYLGWQAASGAPVIGADGMLYVIEGRTVAAISPSGERAWTTAAVPEAPDPYHKFLQSLGIGRQGSQPVVYLGTGGTEPAGQPTRSALHAYNLNGTQRWGASYKIEGAMSFVPASSSAGCAVYLVVSPGGIECVNERTVSLVLEPYRQWRYPASGEISVRTLAVTAAGTAVLCTGQQLTAVTVNGLPQWSKSVPCEDLVVADDGTIYVTATGSSYLVDTVRSFTAGGVERWAVPMPFPGRSLSLAVASGTGGAGTHVLYVAAGSPGETVVAAIRASQEVVWTRTIGARGSYQFQKGLILAADGGLIAGGGPGDNFLAKAWGPDGGERWQIRASGEPGFPVEPFADIQYLAIGGAGLLYGVNFSYTQAANVLLAMRTALYGDSDLNGRFEFADLNRLVDFVLGRTPVAAGSPAFANSDVNGDEVVDMQDVNLYVDCLLKRIDRFPRQEPGSTYCVDSGLTASYGDTNVDGSFSAADLDSLAALILGNPLQFGVQQYVNSDVNRDGAVNLVDLNLSVDCLLGRIAAFPAQPAGSQFCLNPVRGVGDPKNVNSLAAPPTVTAKPGYPVYTVTAQFTNGSTGAIVIRPYFLVKTLAGPACPCTIDGYGGQGSMIPILAGDGLWAPGEMFSQVFPIRVTNPQQRFTFLVDLMGQQAGPYPVGPAPPN